MKETFFNNKGKRILTIVFAFVLLYVVSYVIDPFCFYWDSYFKRSIANILIEWLTSFVTCLLISEFNIRLGSRLNKSLPWTERPRRRLVVETFFNLVNVLLINLLITLVYHYLPSDATMSAIEAELTANERNRGLFQWIAVSCIIALMIEAINTGDYLIVNWKNAAIKAAEAGQVAVEAELQALKLQIDPHFVFNNLSVLSELILEDQQSGYEYAENFSRIYRHIVTSNRQHFIKLDDELKFLHSYIFLIEHRFGKGVHFEIDVDADARLLSIPPLTLQMLAENALKHNRTSKKDPLWIKIYSNENQELVVENRLLPIEKPIDSSGIGISNIIRRYTLLHEKQPEIKADEMSFKVILPLIKL